MAIGRALARKPRVILFDEPFSSLDLPLRAGLRDQVIDLHRRFDTTLVHVTHDQSEAILMGDRVVVLEQGRILQCGTPRAIYERPADRFVATFVGTPPMNILPCQIETRGKLRQGGSARRRHRPRRGPLAWTALPPGWEGTTRLFDLGVRPEAIGVQKATGVRSRIPPEAVSPRCAGWISTAPMFLATLILGPHRLVARLPASQRIEDRQRVEMQLDLIRAVWFDQSTGEAERSVAYDAESDDNLQSRAHYVFTFTYERMA